MSWEKKAKKKTKELLNKIGGKIFVFPIKEEDPFSKFVISVSVGDEIIVFSELVDIVDAATGVLVMRELLEKNNIYTNYERDVRFVVHEPQKNASSITMKKLRDINAFNRR